MSDPVSASQTTEDEDGVVVVDREVVEAEEKEEESRKKEKSNDYDDGKDNDAEEEDGGAGELFEEGDLVLYRSSQSPPKNELAEVLRVHREDDPLRPYYTIQLLEGESGREKQTIGEKLSRLDIMKKTEKKPKTSQQEKDEAEDETLVGEGKKNRQINDDTEDGKEDSNLRMLKYISVGVLSVGIVGVLAAALWNTRRFK